jgi:hypothetical protein
LTNGRATDNVDLKLFLHRLRVSKGAEPTDQERAQATAWFRRHQKEHVVLGLILRGLVHFGLDEKGCLRVSPAKTEAQTALGEDVVAEELRRQLLLELGGSIEPT